MKSWSKWLLVVFMLGVLIACTNSTNSGGCAAPTGTNGSLVPNPGACTLQATIVKADQGYTADLYLDGATPDLLLTNTKAGVGHIARRYTTPEANLNLFIKVYPTYGGWYSSSYNVYSNSTWARVVQTSANAKQISFEDIPDATKSDMDYNDVVIDLEKVNCGGAVEVVTDDTTGEPPVGVEPPAENGAGDPPAPPPVVEPDPTPAPDPDPTVDPTPPPPAPPAGAIVIPTGGIAKVHANFLQATWDAGDLYLDGAPAELLIAKGSNQKGASARNFFAEGEWLVFFLQANGVNYYSTDPTVARVENISQNNYRIYYELNGDGSFDDAIVHIVLTPVD